MSCISKWAKDLYKMKSRFLWRDFGTHIITIQARTEMVSSDLSKLKVKSLTLFAKNNFHKNIFLNWLLYLSWLKILYINWKGAKIIIQFYINSSKFLRVCNFRLVSKSYICFKNEIPITATQWNCWVLWRRKYVAWIIIL